MKILVCVKQVPESEAPFIIEDTGQWIQAGSSDGFRMNRFDESAVEEALLIRETFPETTIDIITVGPVRSEAVVRRAMGMGADNGIHIATEGEGYLGPFKTAFWIASVVREKSYDLILAGVMSEDLMQCQVGSMVAEFLSLPCATSVIHQKINRTRETVYVEREIEGGLREALEVALPCVLTLQTGINRPRYPSLSNLLRANKAELNVIDYHGLDQVSERQKVCAVAYPEKLREGLVLEGTPEEKAEKLLRILAEKAFIE